MATTGEGDTQVPLNIYDVDSSDPKSTLVDRSQMNPAEVAQIGELMASLARLREAEQQLAEASLKYMKLNQTDMRALHFLIVAGNRGTIATPGLIASHLKISSASTTKLLDRLERAGHVVRRAHPTDRRALAITVAPETQDVAMSSIGKQQAKRFHSAARLSSEERSTVIRFLDEMARDIAITNEPWAQEGATP